MPVPCTACKLQYTHTALKGAMAATKTDHSLLSAQCTHSAARLSARSCARSARASASAPSLSHAAASAVAARASAASAAAAMAPSSRSSPASAAHDTNSKQTLKGFPQGLGLELSRQTDCMSSMLYVPSA